MFLSAFWFSYSFCSTCLISRTIYPNFTIIKVEATEKVIIWLNTPELEIAVTFG